MNRFISTSASGKILGCYFLVFFIITGILAQKNSTFSARQITRIPFSTFSGGIVVIRAQLAGYPDTLNFIMDTGSAGISLDSTTCIRMNIIPVQTDKLISGVGGVRTISYVNNQSLLLGQIRIDSLYFHVGDYQILSSEYGDRIDGIIGDSFYKRYIVRIDYDSSEMYVYSRVISSIRKADLFSNRHFQIFPQSGPGFRISRK